MTAMENHRGHHPKRSSLLLVGFCLVLILLWFRASPAEERKPDGWGERAERRKARNGQREALLLERRGHKPCRTDVADDLERRSANHRAVARDELDLHLEDAGDA